MRFHRFKTLRARFTAQLISPVVVMLFVGGSIGFFYARDAMINQWYKAAKVQLEWAAHEIDTELNRPLDAVQLFLKDGKFSVAILEELESLSGVLRSTINWHGSKKSENTYPSDPPDMHKNSKFRIHHGGFTKIGLPEMNMTFGKQTTTVTMLLMDAYDTPVGTLEIIVSFEALVQDVISNAWWQKSMACVVERETGNVVLASSQMSAKKILGETKNPLELSLMETLEREKTGTLLGRGIPPEQVAGFHRLQTFPWALVVFADGKTVLAPILRFRNGFILGVLVLICVVYSIIRFTVSRISGTLQTLSHQAETLASGNYGETIQVASDDEIGRLANSFNNMVQGLEERDNIRNTFGLYVDPDFARLLFSHPESGKLGGRRQKVAILMADISGFTTMAERLSPEETIEVLNRYFSCVIPLVHKHEGIIVDFVGDAILVFFEDLSHSLAAAAKRSVHCAFDIHAAIIGLNGKMMSLGLPLLNVGIGINVGPVVVGNIGSEKRKKYGIVGASVNTAQRIQGQAGPGEVVVSETHYRLVTEHVLLRKQFQTTLKGIPDPVRLFSLAPLAQASAKRIERSN